MVSFTLVTNHVLVIANIPEALETFRGAAQHVTILFPTSSARGEGDRDRDTSSPGFFLASRMPSPALE